MAYNETHEIGIHEIYTTFCKVRSMNVYLEDIGQTKKR